MIYQVKLEIGARYGVECLLQPHHSQVWKISVNSLRAALGWVPLGILPGARNPELSLQAVLATRGYLGAEEDFPGLPWTGMEAKNWPLSLKNR